LELDKDREEGKDKIVVEVQRVCILVFVFETQEDAGK
jgi:hypothetical protein